MKRDQLVTIEEFTPANDLEAIPASWSEFAAAWAAIVPLSGSEYLRAQQMQSTSSHRIRTEFVAGVNPRMRIVYGARVFNVQSVVNVEERNRELEWMCTEVV